MAKAENTESNYSVTIAECSKDLSAKERVQLKDTTDTIKIESEIKTEPLIISVAWYAVLEIFNESASNAQKESGFMRAFAGSDYVKFSAENVYLNDNVAMVEQLTGDNKYLVTVKCDGEFYAIRYYMNAGLIYCDNRVDDTFKTKLCISAEDMDGDLLMMKTHDTYIRMLRSYFERGVFRFKNLQCKSAIIKLLAYK